MGLKIVLIEPEIPQNTGNIGRLCVAIGAELWLVGKLGFSLDEKQVRRAGMDYWSSLTLLQIPTVEEFLPYITSRSAFISTKGSNLYSDIDMSVDMLIFGKESLGLPSFIYTQYPSQLYKLPMVSGVRSINLATAVSAVAYHTMFKNNFMGLG